MLKLIFNLSLKNIFKFEYLLESLFFLLLNKRPLILLFIDLLGYFWKSTTLRGIRMELKLLFLKFSLVKQLHTVKVPFTIFVSVALYAVTFLNKGFLQIGQMWDLEQLG